MCGIAGHLGHLDRQCLERMSARIAHRGPDGSGIWTDSSSQVGLAHRRLSIIDLSEAASQPMRNERRQTTLVYNGELYNYRELRRDLEVKGYSFRTASDTEVVLQMYHHHNVDMLRHLNGMFAFALWDGESRSLFVARDGMGIKPLYYTRVRDCLIFASELKCFLELDGIDSQIDPVALRNYMTFLWSPGERTMLSKIRKLEPGQAFVAKDGEIKTLWRHYRLPYEQPIERMSEATAIEAVRAAVDVAVKRQMVADVPVGAFLSGGLDSSAVVAAARHHARDNELPCYTMRFRDGGARSEGIDEDLPYARQVATHVGVTVDEVDVGAANLKLLPSIVYMMDEPQADVSPINCYLISQAARRSNIKVLLSGMGGDDLFAGYRRHFALEQERYWSWLPERGRKVLSRLGRQLHVRYPMLRRVRKALSFAHLSDNARIASYFYWIDPDVVHDLLDRHQLAGASAEDADAIMLGALDELPDRTPNLNRMLYLDGRYFVPDHNLNYFDKTSMACGVEVRVPLLDLELAKLAARLPICFKQRGNEGKWVLKKAMETILPNNIIYRQKTGFGVPLRAWMRSSLGDLQDDLLSRDVVKRRGYFKPEAVERLRRATDSGEIDGSYTLLSMMNIELWCRIFLDRSLRPDIGPDL